MHDKQLVPIIIAVAIFIFFAHISSSHRQIPAPRSAATEVAVSSTSATATTNNRPKDTQELALELPDSSLPFCRGLNSEKEIALSFDACPTSGSNHFNKVIANTLIETRTPATIFLSGRWVEEDSAATRLLASDSLIELGNHSFTHPHMTGLTPEKMKQQLERTQKIIADLTGKTPFLFRAPYGEYNDTLVKVAKALGLATVQFSVESGDPDTSFTADRLIAWVTKEAKNGSIVIMHINNRGWHTAQALPTIIADLREKGYRLVKVSDLMKGVSEANTGTKLTHSDQKESPRLNQ